MSEPELPQQTDKVDRGRQAAMSTAAIDVVLSDLGAVAGEVIAMARAAERDAGQLLDANGPFTGREAERGGQEPDPRSALTSWRSDVCAEVVKRNRNAARQFVAWWADLATLAVVAPLHGRPVHPVRAAAAEPDRSFSAEDLAHLPGVPDAVRGFAGLSLRMAAAPPYPGSLPDDLRQTTEEYLARFGLRVGRDENGELIAEDDGSPEGRRCRLWGPDWIDDGVPTLPAAIKLADLLTSHGVPVETVVTVRNAAAAVESAVAARQHAREIDADDAGADAADTQRGGDLMPEPDALSDEADQLTDLLAVYARTMTDATAAVRAAMAPTRSA